MPPPSSPAEGAEDPDRPDTRPPLPLPIVAFPGESRLSFAWVLAANVLLWAAIGVLIDIIF